MLRSILHGMAAGGAGAPGLNAVTYADMVVRGRPPRDVPEQSVDALATRLDAVLPGEARDYRRSALGALAGIVTGVGVGAVFGALRRAGVRLPALLAGAAAMAATDVSMAVTGLSDPRTWSRTDWLADAVPHAAYGLVTTAVLDGLRRRR